VQQQQNIAVSSCAKFSLRSDGTRDGTKVEDGGSTDGDTCPRAQETPIPVNGLAFWQKPSSMQRPHAGVTGIPQILQSNSGAKRSISKRLVLVAVLIVLLAMLPGAHASPESHRQHERREKADMRIRKVSNRVKLFAQDFSSDLAEKVAAQDRNGNVLAHNLVVDVVSSVCSEHFIGAKPSDFTPVILQNCVKSVYGGERLALPAVQFSAVFGASLLCGYVVSEAYPVAQEFYPDGCDGLQELARRISPVGFTTTQNDATMIVSQSSRTLVRESSTKQPSASKKTEAASESRIHLSFDNPLVLPTTSLVQNRVFPVDMGPTTYKTLKASTASRSILTVSMEPLSSPLTSLSVSGIPSTVDLTTLLSKSSAVPEPVSSTPSKMVSATTSFNPLVATEPALANQPPLSSNKEGGPADTTRGLSRKVSSTSKSLIDMRSTTAPGKRLSISSQATLDFFPSSQATVTSGSQSPSFPTESAVSVPSVLPDSLAMTSQYTSTNPRQTSSPRSSSRPTSRENETELSVSRSSIDPSTFSSNVPAGTSSDPPFDGWVRTTSLAKSSLMVGKAISSSLENPRIKGQSIPNLTSAPTAQSPGPSSARPAVTSPNNRNMHEHSIIATAPMPEPSWQVNTQTQDACPSVGCVEIVAETTHCDDCESHHTDNLQCHRGSCSSSSHLSNKTSNVSVTGYSSTSFEDLPTALHSSLPSLSSSTPSTTSRMPNSLTAPVYSGNRTPGSVSATNPAPSVLLVSQSLPSQTLPSQSLPQKTTPVPKEAGGFIAKGFDGWW
jgi:hypothetical protein